MQSYGNIFQHVLMILWFYRLVAMILCLLIRIVSCSVSLLTSWSSLALKSLLILHSACHQAFGVCAYSEMPRTASCAYIHTVFLLCGELADSFDLRYTVFHLETAGYTGNFPGRASSVGIQQRAQVQVMEEAWDIFTELKNKMSNSECALIDSKSNFTTCPNTPERNGSQAKLACAANSGRSVCGSIELENHGSNNEPQPFILVDDRHFPPNAPETMRNTEDNGSAGRETADFTPIGALVAALAAVRAAGTSTLH